MLDLAQQVRGEPRQVVDVGPYGLGDGNAEHLVVRRALVLHEEQADGADANTAAGKRWLRNERQGVEGVAVCSQRLG